MLVNFNFQPWLVEPKRLFGFVIRSGGDKKRAIGPSRP